MNEFSNYRLILKELDSILSQVDSTEYECLANDVTGADRIFTAGKGRSGLVANSFAVRLNQLDRNAYVVGEPTTPSVKGRDLFIIILDSSSTEHLRLLAERAQSGGTKIVLLITNAGSPVDNLTGTIIELPAGTKHDVEGSKQPLGSLFEQASLIFLDSVVLPLIGAFHISEKTMQENHADLE